MSGDTLATSDQPASRSADMADRFRRGFRLFATVGDQPRARRATDVILLVLSSIGVGLVGLIAVPEPGFSRAVTDFLVALPAVLLGTWQVLADLPIVWALVVLGVAFARGRRKIGRDMLLSIAVGAVAWLVLARVVNGVWPDFSGFLDDVEAPPVFPSARLAIASALIITAAPHLVRPARRAGSGLLVLGGLASIALGAATITGVVAAVLSGAGAAAIVHLAVGSSAGRPSLEVVRAALADMNVGITELGIASRQRAGHFAVDAVGTDGASLVVRLYGRDAHDSALLSTLWRAIWLREPGSPVGFGRLRQVEHEGLLTLLAAQAGIATDAVVTAGATSSNDAVLVLRRTGAALVDADRFDTDESNGEHSTEVFVDDAPARVRELWDLVGRLHDNGIAHGQLDEDHLVVDDGRLGLIDFQGAAVAPTPAQLRSDDAQMFVTTVGLAGRDVALDALVRYRSHDQIQNLLPYLQPTALTADQRTMLKVLDIDLDDLRDDVATAAGVEAPDLVQLRRFTVGSVVRVALPALAVVILISALAGFDLAEFVDSLQEAVFWLVAIGFVVAQLPRVAQAVSTLGAAPIPLPLGPVYALQLAISYVNLAIPSAAARIAVNVRFFQRQGVHPSAAVATGALDGVSGFIVQALLLGSLLLFSSLSLDVDVSGPASAAVRVVAIVAAILAVALIVILVVPRLRRYVLGAVRRTATEAFGVLRGLRSPRRLAMLFGGNLMAELLFAVALGIIVEAFGFSLPLHELLFINMSVSLLAGLLPVPGGIGVAEGGLILGLTSFGVSQEAAFAAVIVYRLATFYTPPIWGFFALRWLERKRFL
jgi:uncharacterized membrane protein YbhN (UPF0104 family)